MRGDLELDRRTIVVIDGDDLVRVDFEDVCEDDVVKLLLVSLEIQPDGVGRAGVFSI